MSGCCAGGCTHKSAVKRIVQKLGGAVGVDGEVGQGSAFYFILPASAQ